MQNAPKTRRRRRKAGDLAALRRVMWRGLEAAESVLDDVDADRAEVLKACNALASLGGAYAKVVEAHELIPRLEALEAEMKARQ